MELLLLGIGIGWFAHLLLMRRPTPDLGGDIMIEPKRPTRVVRPGEHGGHTPNCPTVDWAKVQRPPGSAVMPPARDANWDLLPGYPPDRSR